MLKRFVGLGAALFLGVASLGCAAQTRYSTAALHAMAPNAGIVDVCMKLPMVTEYYDVVAAYDEDTRTRGTAYYDNLNPQAKQQLIHDLAAYTKAFDAKYGTQLYPSMIRNGFPGSP